MKRSTLQARMQKLGIQTCEKRALAARRQASARTILDGQPAHLPECRDSEIPSSSLTDSHAKNLCLKLALDVGLYKGGN